MALPQINRVRTVVKLPKKVMRRTKGRAQANTFYPLKKWATYMTEGVAWVRWTETGSHDIYC